MVPIALNLVNQKSNGEELGTVRGSSSRMTLNEGDSKRKSLNDQRTLFISQKSSERRPMSSRMASEFKHKQKSMRDLIGYNSVR